MRVLRAHCLDIENFRYLFFRKSVLLCGFLDRGTGPAAGYLRRGDIYITRNNPSYPNGDSSSKGPRQHERTSKLQRSSNDEKK